MPHVSAVGQRSPSSRAHPWHVKALRPLPQCDSVIAQARTRRGPDATLAALPGRPIASPPRCRSGSPYY
eukprot:749791-Hanusia_phi.AAC.2